MAGTRTSRYLLPDTSFVPGAPLMAEREQLLADFVGWARKHITGDEKGQAQIFLDRLFRAFGHPGSLGRQRLAGDANPQGQGRRRRHQLRRLRLEAAGAHRDEEAGGGRVEAHGRGTSCCTPESAILPRSGAGTQLDEGDGEYHRR